MDSKQFDALVARLAAAGPSRRDALKGIVGGALASVTAVSIAESKAATGKQDGKKSNKGKQDGKKGGKGKQDAKKSNEASTERRRRGRRRGCKVQPGQTQCSRRICVDLRTNIAHCGRCFNPCPSGVCVNSVCRAYG
jgi:hypothetical protein